MLRLFNADAFDSFSKHCDDFVLERLPEDLHHWFGVLAVATSVQVLHQFFDGLKVNKVDTICFRTNRKWLSVDSLR